MSTDPLQEQITRFSDAVGDALKQHGTERIKKSQEATAALLLWMPYLAASEKTGCCDEMLKGLHAAAVESAGCIAAGLVRPAIFAMRGQIDLAACWLYYKDHPVEWGHVSNSGDGFIQKGGVFEYLATYGNKFHERLALLDKHKTRSVSDPYRLLSAHIHYQSALVIPAFNKLSALVYPEKRCSEAIQLQSEVSEYVSDLFLAYFGSKWASLPAKILDGARGRVPTEKQPTLFE